eukprot:SAG31_NODE_4346_length_3329_cov_1.499690_1_plen_97_part_00
MHDYIIMHKNVKLFHKLVLMHDYYYEAYGMSSGWMHTRSLSSDEVAALRLLFDSADVDHDGSLTAEEFDALIAAQRASAERTKREALLRKSANYSL